MMIKFGYGLISFLSIILITNCGSSESHKFSMQTNFPAGRNLYYSKCISCHKAYEPKMYTAEQWKNILNEMGKKAKLNSTEIDSILNYLNE